MNVVLGISLNTMNGLPPFPMYFPIFHPRSKKNSRDGNTASSNNTTSNDTSNNHCTLDYVSDSYCTLDRVICALGIIAVILVIYILLLPGPQPDNPMLEFKVNSLEVTSMRVYNGSNNDYYSIVRNQKHIMADLDFNVTLKTKDDIPMYYSPMQVSLQYQHDEFLSSTVLEPFLLLGDHHDVQFGMQINNDARIQNKTVDSISRDLWGQNVVQFALKARGHYLRWRGYIQKCGISVACDDIKVGFVPASNWTTTGSLIVSPYLCQCKSDCPEVLFTSTAQ